MVRVCGKDGRSFDALTFVARRDSASYAGGLSQEEQARIASTARGERGSCLDYLRSTHRHLEEMGVPCPKLESLLRRMGG